MPASKIAIIETRLPYTDRRALSEAWFSALHLTNDVPKAASDAHRTAASPEIYAGSSRAHAREERADRGTPRREHVSSIERAAKRAAYAGLDVPLRRASDPRVAATAAAVPGDFERARSYPPFRTSLTLEGANGTRVHLIVRRIGPTLHVVALCPPAVAELVRRALARADIHFRARGESLQIDVNEHRATA